MTIDELQIEAHGCALSKGWWVIKRTPLEIHALIHSEIAEATEAVRDGEQEATELADAVIRIADYFGQRGWDLDTVIRRKMCVNRKRSYRHGGKSA